MQTVIIIVHLMIVVALVVVVLLQRSEGGALGIGGGGGFMSGRAQANALTRATAILAGLFFVSSLALAILAHVNAGPRSIFQTTPAAAPPAGVAKPAVPTKGGILPMLQHPGASSANQPQNPVTQAPTTGQAPVHTAPATKPPAPTGQAPSPAPATPQVPTSR
jgi:preprotein translocase subunit SecG